MLKLKLTNKAKGFTIIEVLIVLAIAALILLVVFLAVPGLQRAQKNNAAKADVHKIAAAILNYEANNPNITVSQIGTPPSTWPIWPLETVFDDIGSKLVIFTSPDYVGIPYTGMTSGVNSVGLKSNYKDGTWMSIALTSNFSSLYYNFFTSTQMMALSVNTNAQCGTPLYTGGGKDSSTLTYADGKIAIVYTHYTGSGIGFNCLQVQ